MGVYEQRPGMVIFISMLDDPQVIEEGVVIYDTCYGPWTMDDFINQNEFRTGDNSRLWLSYGNRFKDVM